MAFSDDSNNISRASTDRYGTGIRSSYAGKLIWLNSIFCQKLFFLLQGKDFMFRYKYVFENVEGRKNHGDQLNFSRLRFHSFFAFWALAGAALPGKQVLTFACPLLFRLFPACLSVPSTRDNDSSINIFFVRTNLFECMRYR